jgi:hypothetical protein
MNFKNLMIALTVAGLAAFGTGCGGACDDLEDCCNALPGVTGCTVSDEADDDDCQAILDQYAKLPDAPDECK